MKFTLPPDEEARIRSLHSYGILDSEPEQAFDDLVFLAKTLCDVPIALISLVDTDRQWFKARLGTTARQTDRASAFCSRAILHEHVMIVPDALGHPELKSSSLVTGPPHLRFYAGAPLITAQGHALGTICVADSTPRTLTPEQELGLASLARQVIRQLELRLTNRQIQKSYDELEAARSRAEQSTSELTLVMSTIPSLLIAVDAGGIVKLWNAAAESTLQAPAIHALGRRIEDLGIPWEMDRVAESLAKCRDTRQSVRIDDLRLSFETQQRSLGLTFYSMKDAPYGRGSALILGADVTEKLAASLSLRGQAAMLTAICHSIPCGFVLTDDVGSVLYSNSQLGNIWGIHDLPIATPGSPFALDDLCRRLASSTEDPNFVLSEIQSADATLKVREIQLRNRRTLRENSLNICDANQACIGRLYLIEDISSQKAAEKADVGRREFENLLTSLSSEFIHVHSDQIDEGLLAAIRRVCEFSKMDRATIYLLSGDNERYEMAYGWQNGKTEPIRQEVFAVDRVKWLHDRLVQFEPVFLSNIEQLPSEADDLRSSLSNLGLGSVIELPLACNRQLLGFVSFSQAKAGYEWSPQEVALLKIVSGIFANAIARKRADHAIRQLAERALLESEQRLQAVIGSAPVLLFAIDESRKIVLWEGQSPVAFDAGSHPETDQLSALLPGFAEALDRAYLGEMVSTSIEIPNSQFDCRLRPVRNALTDTVGVIGVLTDMTERRQMETRLAFAQKMEGIGQLAAGVAHEINTPMQYILANTSFLQDSFGSLLRIHQAQDALRNAASCGHPPNDAALHVQKIIEDERLDYLLDEIPRCLEQTIHGIDRVSKIVSAMKEFSHPSGNALYDVNINHVVTSTLTVTHHMWRFAADVQTHLEPSLPTFKGMADQITQTIANLIGNAIDAIQDEIDAGRYDKGRIDVSTSLLGDCIEIRVSDNGKGMPESVRSRAFELFFTTKDPGKGTGQGLPITHQIIVEKHRGSIEVQSTPGEGTTFVILLPVNSQGRQAA